VCKTLGSVEIQPFAGIIRHNDISVR
jgi:hypothetical protein